MVPQELIDSFNVAVERAHEQLIPLQDEAYERGKFDGRKWIPVTERTPAETEWCLCFGDGAVMCYAWCKERQRWENLANATMPGLDLNAITHWMSLPEPPAQTPSQERTRDAD